LKTKEDHFTSEMFGNRVGRPRKLNPKSDAQRQREYRKRQSAPAPTHNQFPSQSDENSNCNFCVSHGKRCTGICCVAQLGHKD
jgi:hypothetical protein